MPNEPGAEEKSLSPLPRRRWLALEVLALCATHLTNIVSPLFGVGISSARMPFNPGTWVALISEFPRLLLYLFVMYGSGDPLERFGLKLPRRKDATPLLLGVGGSIMIHVAFAYWSPLVHASPSTHPHLTKALQVQVASFPELAITCLMVGCFEEVAFRGYLIPRLEELSGKTWLAVLAQALFFGVAHSYQGPTGVINATLLGLLYGLVFVKYRTVWPIAVAHGLYDLAIAYLNIAYLR